MKIEKPSISVVVQAIKYEVESALAHLGDVEDTTGHVLAARSRLISAIAYFNGQIPSESTIALLEKEGKI